MAGNLKKGVPFATPVFDGATKRNQAMLDLAYPAGDRRQNGFTRPDPGARLHDGRTGEPSSAHTVGSCTC